MLYTIEETTALNARREGVTRDFKSLTDAKRYATRNQVFQGTVLNIYDESETRLAFKLRNQWIKD